jgi:hypothetical protein
MTTTTKKTKPEAKAKVKKGKEDTDVKFWLTDKNQRFSHQQITQQNEITERKMYKIYGCVKHQFIIDV